MNVEKACNKSQYPFLIKRILKITKNENRYELPQYYKEYLKKHYSKCHT